MRRKAIIKIAGILMISLLITSCSNGKYITKMSTGNNGKNYMEMSYDSFKGYKYTTVKLHKGDTLNLTVEIKTDSGNLAAKVIDEKDNEIYSIENPEGVVNKSIDISQDGEYKVEVDGDHSGSFNVKWDVQ